jgi:hypothetical protein
MIEGNPETPAKLVLTNGLIIGPPCSLKSLPKLIEWQLSPTDFDVNYIVHAVKL